jgi:hypothetical protein
VNFKIEYLKQHKEKQRFCGFPTNTVFINPQYKKIMKHVGKAIKDGKEVIFNYQDNWITIEIND